jgi:hypothetical protein
MNLASRTVIHFTFKVWNACGSAFVEKYQVSRWISGFRMIKMCLPIQHFQKTISADQETNGDVGISTVLYSSALSRCCFGLNLLKTLGGKNSNGV